jgi:hypothetical protein
MADHDDALLALAATLRRAVAELARVCVHDPSRGWCLAKIERWTLRWVELVEETLPRVSDGRAAALRRALDELRSAFAGIHPGSLPRGDVDLPGRDLRRFAGL